MERHPSLRQRRRDVMAGGTRHADPCMAPVDVVYSLVSEGYKILYRATRVLLDELADSSADHREDWPAQ